jgi:amidohydrolase
MLTVPNVLDRARALEDEIRAWRRDIHQHPELGFQEYRTAKLVAEALTEMGIEAETGVGITGVVARIGEGRPAIGIRADMDALPIQEATGAEYSSQTPNVMHACGHDAHTAILLGVAKMLNSLEDRPAGEIRLLFQPAEEMQDEEGKSGAMRMIDDGALEDLDAVIALHVGAGTPSGKIEVRSGYAMAAADAFEAVIHGTGGHGAGPHRGTDPIFMLAQVINVIHGIRARRINPIHPAVISIGGVHAGDADNVIPSEVRMNGTIRSYDEDIRKQLHEELEKAFGIVEAMGGSYDLKIINGYDATYNDPDVCDLMEVVVDDIIGKDQLIPAEPGMGAEDFGYMTRKAPGAMFFLGAKYDEKNRAHHTPIFDIDESALPVGAAILAETACRLLKQKAQGE